MGERGLSLVEVMVATVVSAVGLAGAVSMFQWAEHGLQVGANGTRAMALAASRVEAKRAVPWERLFIDTPDEVGGLEQVMADDGRAPDLVAGDGIYTAAREREGIRVVWTVQPERRGGLQESAHVMIRAIASYRTPGGREREIALATLRANPRYVGSI